MYLYCSYTLGGPATVLGLKESVTDIAIATTTVILHQSSVFLHLHLALPAQEVDLQ